MAVKVLKVVYRVIKIVHDQTILLRTHEIWGQAPRRVWAKPWGQMGTIPLGKRPSPRGHENGAASLAEAGPSTDSKGTTRCTPKPFRKAVGAKKHALLDGLCNVPSKITYIRSTERQYVRSGALLEGSVGKQTGSVSPNQVFPKFVLQDRTEFPEMGGGLWNVRRQSIT